jgi:hypothetical protein
VREVNTPPQIQPVPLQQTDELAPFAFSVVATDADQPPNILTFQVVDPPAGLNINPGTGAITWTATEAQGPSTNRVIVLVRDQSPTADQPELWATNSFEIIVREVNTPPSIQTASRQETDELAPFSFNVIGSDPDVPANLLSYELIAAPPGLTIDAHTGAMSWTPEETQGPSTNLITVTVKDQNLSAAQPELRATNTFEVVVREVNSPPVLPNRDPQSIRYGSLLSFTPLFEDSDVPANSVSFELISGPTNLTVEPTAGLISWVPAPGQLGTNIIVLRAIDDGVPALSTTNAFQVWVTGVEPSLTIQLLPGGLMQVSISGDTGLVYDLEHSADLETWQSLVRLNVPSSPYPYIDPGSVGPERRYYRARVVP